MDYFIKRRIENRIPIRVIMSNSKIAHKRHELDKKY